MASSDLFIQLAGWFPAIILPSATSIQLIKIIREKTADGVSLLSWGLFGVANIGLYIYAEKYFSLQSIIGQLGTALLDFLIIIVVMTLNAKKEHRY